MTNSDMSAMFEGRRYTGRAVGPFLVVPEPAGASAPAPLPSPEDIAAALGARLSAEQLAPLAELHAARERAQIAARAMDAGRPGGEVWREAERADAEAAVSGKAIKSWRLAELLRTDADRWAAAVATRAAEHRVAREFDAAGGAGASLRRAVKIAAAIEQTATEKLIYQHAETGWQSRDDKSKAWVARAAADALVPRVVICVRLQRWANGAEWDAGPVNAGAIILSGGAGGYLRVIRMFLDNEHWTGPISSQSYPADAARTLKQSTSGALPVVR
jgi:hypothetical protein